MIFKKMWIFIKILMPMGVNDSMEFLIDKIKGSKNNSDFFESIKSWMKVISWNINSIRIRKLKFLSRLIKQEELDFICLQETKSSDDSFPKKEFQDLNYFVYINGMPSYNGVGILSIHKVESIFFVTKMIRATLKLSTRE